VADIAQNVRIAYDGQVVTSARYGEQEVGFRVLIERQYRQQLDYLRQLRIPNRQGELVALDEVASLDIGPGTAVFHHYEGERSITVEANIVRGATTPVKVAQLIERSFDLSRDYAGTRLVVGGEAQETQESFIDLGATFIIAFLGIYFLLVLLFNSLTQPFMVMLAIPFSIGAVILTFALHGQPLTFLAMVGVVGLAGVVVNDSLVLVDHLNMLKRENKGSPIARLIAQGTADRLRPIILTSLTTVAGLLPLAYGIGGEDLLVGPMALALGYGLLLVTPLTLVLIPCLYMIGNDIRRLFRSKNMG
jgi:multidrug efflux pump subunit AcrB